MNKLSVRHFTRIRKLSRRESLDIDRVIGDMKKQVKSDPDVKAKFKEYDIPLDAINDVHVEFADLDVSAKTKDGKIYLNEKMLGSDSEVKDPTHYLAHELVHFLQQLTGNTAGHKLVDDYLEKPTEVEAFQVQVKFKERHEGEDEAAEYVEDLLDHHDVKDPKDRKDKKEEIQDS